MMKNFLLVCIYLAQGEYEKQVAFSLPKENLFELANSLDQKKNTD